MIASPSPSLVRRALEELLRSGPALRVPVEDRLAAEAQDHPEADRAAALAEARRAVAAAEVLGHAYVAGQRSQESAIAELVERFPWLGPREDGLADRLGSRGYYLAIK